MRYLHPVGPHEEFVASGTYRYTHDGVFTGLLEHWTIHELPDGAWFFRVDKDGRDDDGRTEFIEAWRSPPSEGGQLERFDLVTSGIPGDMPRRVRATYTREEQVLHVGRSLDGEDQIRESIEIPQHVGIQPGAYVFFGLLLPAIVEHAPYPVLMRYGLQTPPENSYRAVVTRPSVTFYGEDTVVVANKDRPARRYMAAITAEEGVEWHSYWVDSNGIFLRHEGGPLVVQLERYAHRP